MERDDTGNRHADKAETTAEEQRQIQREAEAREKSANGEEDGEGAVQMPDRERPESPLPPQHQQKPGFESELKPRPQFRAPTYKGSEKLKGLVALVTGADSGIGRAVAVLFAREGADVAVAYLSEHEDAEETKAAVETEGQRAILLPGDVTDVAYCRDAVDRTIREFGRLDILVNNAAFQQHMSDLTDISEEQFERTIRTNLVGYFNMAKAALPHLEEGGAIINSGSVTGIRGAGSLLDYATTKGGIHAFTKSLAQNVVGRGIRVNAVAPGPVWTPLNPADKFAEDVKEFGADVPMGRPAQPEEIAPAYVFLAAQSTASYITGVVLPILGGEVV